MKPCWVTFKLPLSKLGTETLFPPPLSYSWTETLFPPPLSYSWTCILISGADSQYTSGGGGGGWLNFIPISCGISPRVEPKFFREICTIWKFAKAKVSFLTTIFAKTQISATKFRETVFVGTLTVPPWAGYVSAGRMLNGRIISIIITYQLRGGLQTLPLYI